MTDDKRFVLLVCNDLFFGSKITGAAGATGLAIQVDSSGCLERLGDDTCVGVILDLNHPTASPENISAAAPTGLRLLAFGPHVRTELFNSAKSAGFETVTRGQLDRAPSEVVNSFAS